MNVPVLCGLHGCYCYSAPLAALGILLVFTFFFFVLKFVFSILVSLLQMNSNYHGAAALEPRDTALKSINFASNDECSVSVTAVHVFDAKIIK